MALQEKDKIKDLFSSKLKDFEAEVPSSLWDGIDQALSQQQVIVTTPQKPRIPLLKAISIAASIIGTIVVATAVFMMLRPQEGIGQRASEELQHDILKVKPVVFGNQQEGIQDVHYGDKQTFGAEKHPVAKVTSQRLKLHDIEGPSTLLCNVPEEDINLTGIIKPQHKQVQRRTENSRFYASSGPIILPSRKREDKGTFLGLNTGSGLLASNFNKENNLSTFSTKSNLDIEETFTDQIIDLEHNQPISFGILVNKQLSSRLSIETGLTYTYLSSRFKSKMYPEDVSGKTNFHYLGVPVHLNYTFLQLGKANFYVSVGAEIEKDIQGRLKWSVKNEKDITTNAKDPVFTSLEETNNFSIFSERTNIHQDNLQFSAHMTVGASYPIYQKLHVYGTVGGAYYFDANNEYPTIYSDKKLQLDLNLGLKWKF